MFLIWNRKDEYKGSKPRHKCTSHIRGNQNDERHTRKTQGTITHPTKVFVPFSYHYCVSVMHMDGKMLWHWNIFQNMFGMTSIYVTKISVKMIS